MNRTGFRISMPRLLKGLRGPMGLSLLFILSLAILGQFLAPYDPGATSTAALQAPSVAHPMGTDDFGRDILSRVLYASRLDLLVAVVATALAFTIGSITGAVAAYVGGLVDLLVMRVIEILQSFPMFVLALALVALVFGPGTRTMIIVIAAINIPIFARLMRAEILPRKKLAYVDAARCGGDSWVKILFYHLYPNAAGPVLATATLMLAWAILDVAALSFIGVGVQPPTPEWGVMLSEGAPYVLSGEWWVSFFPGLAISLVVLAFNYLGDRLQARTDPRQRIFVRG